MDRLMEALQAGKELSDPLILKEYDPPMLRFENSTLKDGVESEKVGEYRPKNAVLVHVRAWGDIKNEVPYIVKTTVQTPKETDVVVRKTVPVDVIYVDEHGKQKRKREYEEQEVLDKEVTYVTETIYPWFDDLKERVRHNRIPQAYLEHCRRAYEQWEKHGEVALDGFPVDDWKIASPAQVEVLKSIGINTVERVADMTEDAIGNVGMGARELKKKAAEWLLAGKDQNAVVAKIAALEARLTAYEEEERRLKVLAAAESQLESTQTEDDDDHTVDIAENSP